MGGMLMSRNELERNEGEKTSLKKHKTGRNGPNWMVLQHLGVYMMEKQIVGKGERNDNMNIQYNPIKLKIRYCGRRNFSRFVLHM
jgi:hypothetical protein